MHNDKVHNIQLLYVDKFTSVNYNVQRELNFMLEKWIGDLVGQMHSCKISKTDLADHMGVTREYVSMILNGHRCPQGVEERMKAAVNELAAMKKES